MDPSQIGGKCIAWTVLYSLLSHTPRGQDSGAAVLRRVAGLFPTGLPGFLCFSQR